MILTSCRLASILFFVVFLQPIVNGQIELPYKTRVDEPTPEWVREMYKPNADPGLVMKLYEEYYDKNEFVKNGHTQYYKRWMRELSRHITPDPVYDPLYLNQYRENQQSRMANWSTVGPIDWDHSAAARSYAPGSAHVYTVEQSISNPNVLYAGTANAGLWRSNDRGLTWTPKMNTYIVGTVYAIEISPTNADIVYAELLNNIYKTTNGGNTWTSTGDGPFQALSFSTRDIRCKPDAATNVFAATSAGLYRSTNSGTTWTQLMAGDFLEIEFHPTRPDTMYAVRKNGMKTEFYRSFNNGTTLTLQSAGWPNPNTTLGEHQERTEISVSPNEPDKVFALATGSADGGSGLYGIYVSSNLGSNWTFSCCGPGPGGPPSASNMNLMGWNDQGLDDGGQYYYDLAFGMSPFDADSMWVCGVNQWVSGNQGSSFVCPAAWSHSYKPNYVHADIHDFNYYAHTGEIWIACDGGIFFSDDSGANYHRRNVGIAGSDFWGFGMGHWFGNVMIGGAYHNGTLLREEDTYINGWLCTDGGDGVGGYVNPGLDRQAYSNYNIKKLKSDRTIAPETRDFHYQPNSTYITGQSSELLFHPNYYGTWYTGSGTSLYRTRDNGYTYEQIHNFGVDLAAMDLCQSDPNVIYVCTFPDWWGTKRIYRSIDAGDNWTEITPTGSTINNADAWIPYDIAVDENDPMKIWIVRTSMYGDYPNYNGYKVFTSTNGGDTWSNISGANLNGQYPTCLMRQKGTNGGIYIGTRRSVYYRNSGLSDWQLYSNNLPARIHSTKLMPWYRKGKIRNATDRSVWESDFYEPSIPKAVPSVQKQYFFCSRDTAYFTDLSTLNETNATWNWSFPGGVPSSSNVRNPKVVYPLPGHYDVTLTVQDINGSSTTTMSDLITVDSKCEIDTTPGGALSITANLGYSTLEEFEYSGENLTVTAWIKPNGIQSDYSAIFMTDGTAGGLNFREGNNTLGYHWPGGEWWWDSNLIVPAGEWSYVSLVISNNSIAVSVNGVQAVHNINAQVINSVKARIGNYQGWESRTFKGQIDEVCIWNRSLTLEEIRLKRHLIKNPSLEPNLIRYFQYDILESSNVVDKANGFDATLSGPATLITSDAPVGVGTSQIQLANHTGLFNYLSGGDVKIDFGSNHPNGLLAVTHLRNKPDVLPANKNIQGGYWIFNNYGSTTNINQLDSLVLTNCGSISNAMVSTLNGQLYSRNQNAAATAWSTVNANSFVVTPGVSGKIKALNPTGFSSLGQTLIMRDTVQHGLADVTFVSNTIQNLEVKAGSSISMLMRSDHQGFQLPVIDLITLSSLGTPTAGQFAFLSDSAKIIMFIGNRWTLLEKEAVLIDEPNEPLVQNPGTFTLLNPPANESAILTLSPGLINPPVFINSTLLDVDELSIGMLVFDSVLKGLIYYNGSSWTTLTAKPINIPISTLPPLSVAGIAINQTQKYPSASLDINASDGKAMQLPIVDPQMIYSPTAGLVCVDPNSGRIFLYDGSHWNYLK